MLKQTISSSLEDRVKALVSSKLELERGQSWSCGQETLQYINDNAAGMNSIETGIGHTTFIFALRSKAHTVCFLDPTVETNVRKYALDIDLNLSNVRFVSGKSQYTLPALQGQFDFALIDGDHMFPSPSIDFYYINQLMSVRGIIMVDDLQIPAVKLVLDFLSVSSKWKLQCMLDDKRVCVFKKIVDDKYDWWGSQEYNIPQSVVKLKML